ncbi:MAG: HEPN domain-containing protein [Chloroflexi bacterium]|nr:HEPN domain-containing protein [Chloroflexota bacterium]
MIAVTELRQMANARLEDARALRNAERYDASMYLCGYAVELALKARICETLNWGEFPEKSGEFRNYQSLQTHNLDVLLDFTGIQGRVNAVYAETWKYLKDWGPNWRYLPVDSADEHTCLEMLDAVEILLEVI